MLSKKRKINSSTIKKVLHSGASYSSPLFSLKIIKNTLNGGFSISVSSRVVKTKVERNKIKRRVYNALNSVLKTSFLGEGFIFVKRNPTSISYKKIKQEIVDLLIKVGVDLKM